MSGFPAFQGSPVAFQANAFQAGVNLVAADYSLGPLAWGVATLQINYQLAAPPPFWLGSPDFATPPLGEIAYSFTAPNYSLGSPVFATPSLRATQRLNAPAYSLGPLAWTKPALVQTHRFAAPQPFWLGPLAWSSPPLIRVSALTAPPFWLGSPEFTAPASVLINHILAVNDWSLQKLSFAFPRMTTELRVQLWPLTYLSQIEDAAEMLRKMLNILLSSIPAQPITDERNTVRRLISILRANAEEAIRSETLGTQLEAVFQAADAARVGFAGVDQARQFLMTQVASRSFQTQFVFRNALVMVLALECKVISRIQFSTQTQIRNMILYMRDAFDAAKAIGIDEVDIMSYQALNAMSGTLMNHLAMTELQLPRFAIYETAFPMPSLYLAQRIYQNAARADEIEKENGVIHPAFMPRKLRVLSDAGIPLEEKFLRPRPPVT